MIVSDNGLEDVQAAAKSLIRAVYQPPAPKGKKLNLNEKKALYGLIRYPYLKDKEICEHVGLKVSTFTAIKSRLLKMGFYRTIRVPNFPNLGYNILAIVSFRINPKTGAEKRRAFYRDVANLHPNIFFFFDCGEFASFMCFFDRFRDAKALITKVKAAKHTHGVSGEVSHYMYEMEQSSVINMFDFTGAVIHAFYNDLAEGELEDDIKRYLQFDRSRIRSPTIGARPMKRFERMVYRALIENPALPDKGVAEKVGITRQSVARLKKRFLEDQLYMDRNIPNLRFLGLNVLVFVHATLNPMYSIKDRVDGLQHLYSMIPSLFWISDNMSSTFFSVFKDYPQYERIRTDAEKYYFNRDYLLKEPLIIPLSLTSFKYIKGLEFNTAIERIMKDLEGAEREEGN